MLASRQTSTVLRAALVAVAFFSLPLRAGAGEAKLDAEHRRLTCNGVGAPRLRDAAGNPAVARAAAERAARRDARQACLAALAALPLRGGGTVGESMRRDASLAREVDALVRKARTTGVPRYFADGGVALDLALPLDGALGRLLRFDLPDPAPGGVAPAAP